MPAAFTIPSIFTAIDKFSAPIRKMGGTVNNFVIQSQAGLSLVERGFRRLMTPLTAINKMLMGMGYYVGLFTFIAILRGAVGVMADFEQSQVNLSTVIDKQSIPLLGEMGKQARMVAVQYGQAADKVANLQYELAKMGFTASDIMNMTPAITTGAVALRTTPERLSEITAGILLSYEKDASQTKDVINKLAYAANLTAADFESYATQLPIVSRVAKISGESYEKVLAYLGTLRNVQIHTSTGSTSLKNIIIDAAKKGESFRTAIEKVASSNNAVVYAANKFGKRSVVSAIEFSKQLDFIDSLVGKIENAPANYVENLAAKQLNTFKGAVLLAQAAYREFIYSIDDGSGKYSGLLKNALHTATAMILLASGTEAAANTLKTMSPDIVRAAERYNKLLSILMWVAKWLLIARIAMYAWATAIWLATAAQTAYNIAIGIGAGIGLLNVKWLRAGTLAMSTYTFVVGLASKAAWLFNAAMAFLSGPIALIIALLALLSLTVVTLLDHWNEWGAAVSMFLGPLGLVLSIVQSIRRNWESLKYAFTEEGFIAGIKKLAMVMYDALLMPLQQIYQLMSHLPGKIGSSSMEMAKLIEAYRQSLGVNMTSDEEGKVLPRLNGEKAKEEFRSEITTQNKNIRVDFNNLPWGTEVSGDKDVLGKMTPKLGPTMGWSMGAQTEW